VCMWCVWFVYLSVCGCICVCVCVCVCVWRWACVRDIFCVGVYAASPQWYALSLLAYPATRAGHVSNRWSLATGHIRAAHYKMRVRAQICFACLAQWQTAGYWCCFVWPSSWRRTNQACAMSAPRSLLAATGRGFAGGVFVYSIFHPRTAIRWKYARTHARQKHGLSTNNAYKKPPTSIWQAVQTMYIRTCTHITFCIYPYAYILHTSIRTCVDFEWCCFYHSIMNSLVALRDALFARTYVHFYMHWYIHTGTSTYIYTKTCTNLLSRLRTRTYPSTHLNTRTRTKHTHTHTCIHIYVHTYTYSYMHAYIPTAVASQNSTCM